MIDLRETQAVFEAKGFPTSIEFGVLETVIEDRRVSIFQYQDYIRVRFAYPDGRVSRSPRYSEFKPQEFLQNLLVSFSASNINKRRYAHMVMTFALNYSGIAPPQVMTQIREQIRKQARQV